jgi:GlpG protein
MRLIGEFKENQFDLLKGVCSYLRSQSIECELHEANSSEGLNLQLWIFDEDHTSSAIKICEEALQNPQEERFQFKGDIISFLKKPLEITPPPVRRVTRGVAGFKNFKISTSSKGQKRLTNWILFLCIFIFTLNSFQEKEIEGEYGIYGRRFLHTNLEKELLFDYDFKAQTALAKAYRSNPIKSPEETKLLSKEAELTYQRALAIPRWKGYADLFVTYKTLSWKAIPKEMLFKKIRQGEVWRLFTPSLMHGSFLHIFFNMSWLWMLGQQIESRLKKGKMALLILLISGVSNTAQYLIGGAEFLGFSGVIIGLVGFIWVRQKRAPWEGYVLQRSTALFLFIFVGGMLVLEWVSMGMQYFDYIQISANLANTGHVIGGLTGAVLALLPIFSKDLK